MSEFIVWIDGEPLTITNNDKKYIKELIYEDFDRNQEELMLKLGTTRLTFCKASEADFRVSWKETRWRDDIKCLQFQYNWRVKDKHFGVQKHFDKSISKYPITRHSNFDFFMLTPLLLKRLLREEKLKLLLG